MVVLAAPLAWPSGQAQSAEATLFAGGGAATDQRGLRSTALTLAPSFTIMPTEALSVQVGGSLTRFQRGDLAFGGNASLGTRHALAGPLAVAGAASASVAATSFDARYSSVDVSPTLEAGFGRLTLYAGARLAGGSSAFASSTDAAPLGRPAPTGGRVTTSRSSVGPLAGLLVDVAGQRPGQRGTLGYREERARVEQTTVVDRVATAALYARRLSVAAHGGWRDAPGERVAFGGASAAVDVGRALALQLAGGRYPSNRMTGAAGGTFVNVGLVLRGLQRAADPGEPTVRVAGTPPVVAGATRLVLRATQARRVELAGSWNDWTPIPATRAADGTWYADVRLGRGSYRYAFRVDGSRWVVPEHVATVDDGFGGRSALLSVR